MSEFRFSDPKNTACIACNHVVYKRFPILHVSHDEEDGGWQFLCGVNSHTTGDAVVLLLEEAAEIDPSLNSIAYLEQGFEAKRETVNGNWIIERSQS